MDKLVRNIIISVVVVLLLGAAYVAISVIPGQIAERNIEEQQAEKGDIAVFRTAVENVSSVKVTNEKGSYTFMRDETGTWAIKEYPEFLLETTSIESAVYGLSNIYAL
ncbi:MAG: hypothetical protein WCX81_04750, partial [Monoglobales bacterium]